MHAHTELPIPSEKDPLLSSKSGYCTTSEVGVELEKQQLYETTNDWFGRGLMLTSAVFFCLQASVSRYATGYAGLPPSVMAVIRGSVQSGLAFFLSFTLMDYKKVYALTPRLTVLLAIRGSLGALTFVITIASLSCIPIGIFMSLFFISTFRTPQLTYS